MAGGFNNIRFLEELNNDGGRMNSGMRGFNYVIEDLELRYLPLQGGCFTWNGELNKLLKLRLDRFLISVEWEGLFSDVIQNLLPTPLVYHHPFLLDGGDLRSRRTCSGLRMWLKEEGFMSFVQN